MIIAATGQCFLAASGWNFISTGDYNGDGTTELLFRNAASGLVADWIIEDQHSSKMLHIVPQGPGSGSDWKVL